MVTTTERRSTAIAYDGFVSYSHAADGLLAPRLQSGLQRFAKPWWKRRATRIFRDESSLSANPHLWSSITDALDASAWFILLLSPAAAESSWVTQEIEYWKTHRDPSRILPVVTDGGFEWFAGDVSGSAVPESLNGVFSQEPRWVDLRFARDEEHLDLQNPTFSGAIADIASAIRGIPKDDLASEEVRQHRRTVRTAWAAAGLVVMLAIASVGFAVSSAQNAEDADRSARLARSRELSSAAVSVIEEDQALATRLVVHAAAIAESDELPTSVVDALWRAGAANKLVDVVDLGETLHTSMALSDDGSLLVVAQASTSLAFPDVLSTGRLVVMETATLETVWEWLPESGEGVVLPAISTDGRLVVGVESSPDSEQPLGRLEVFDLDTGDPVMSLEYSGCKSPGAPAWSPDGSLLAVATSVTSPCQRRESSTGRWVELIDADTWQSIRVDELPATDLGSHPQWSDDGRLYVFGSHVAYRYAEDFSSLDPLLGVAGFGDVSPDGTMLATFNLDLAIGQGGLAVFDAETLERVDLLPWEGFPRFPVGIAFTDDSQSLFVAPEGAKTNLFDVESGHVELTLPTGVTDGVLRDENSGLIYTSHSDGTVKIWRAASAAYGLEWLEDLGSAPWVNGSNSFRAGDGITAFDHWDLGEGVRYISFFDQTTGEFVAQPMESFSLAEPTIGGRFAIGLEPTRLWSIEPRSGDLVPIYETEFDMWFTVSIDGREIAVFGFQGEPFNSLPQWWETIDPNGVVLGDGDLPNVEPIAFDLETVLTIDTDTREFVAIDRKTGAELWRKSGSFFAFQVTEHGFETLGQTLFSVADFRTGEASSIQIEVDRPRGFQMSPSRDRIAIGDVERMRIIDAESGIEVQTIPIPGVSDIHWIDEETIVIGSRDGIWSRLSLDTSRLLEGARSSIRSSFTESQCEAYAIAPCPSLEELQGG